MKSLSQLPLIELLRLKTKFELPKNLRDSIMLRGLEAEWGEREGTEDFSKLSQQIEELMNDVSNLGDEKYDLVQKLKQEKAKTEKLDRFLRETIADINVNILKGEKSIETLKKEFVDLRSAAQELLDKSV